MVVAEVALSEAAVAGVAPSEPVAAAVAPSEPVVAAVAPSEPAAAEVALSEPAVVGFAPEGQYLSGRTRVDGGRGQGTRGFPPRSRCCRRGPFPAAGAVAQRRARAAAVVAAAVTPRVRPRVPQPAAETRRPGAREDQGAGHSATRGSEYRQLKASRLNCESTRAFTHHVVCLCGRGSAAVFALLRITSWAVTCAAGTACSAAAGGGGDDDGTPCSKKKVRTAPLPEALGTTSHQSRAQLLLRRAARHLRTIASSSCAAAHAPPPSAAKERPSKNPNTSVAVRSVPGFEPMPRSSSAELPALNA